MAETDDGDGEHSGDDADGDPSAAAAMIVALVITGLAARLSIGVILGGRLEGVRKVGLRAQKAAGCGGARGDILFREDAR